MIPPHQVEPTDVLSDYEEGSAAVELINQHAEAIAGHLNAIGPAELYAQAKKEAEARRRQIHERATMARENHVQNH